MSRLASTNTNPTKRSGSLLESHKNYDPRILLFYGVIAAMMLTLAGGLGYQQLTKVDEYSDRERQQNQRRVLFPGPRGNIYDRHGKLLVGNNHRFAVLLHLDELKAELRREQLRIYKNFVAAEGKKEVPSDRQLRQLSRVSLVQRYLDQVNRIIGRSEKVDAKELDRHFESRLLLPYTLLDNLETNEYARLIEGLPVTSPLEVFASNVRAYPFGSAAAHTLGYVRPDNAVDADGFPGESLTTFKMTGTVGKDGLEKSFDEHLSGEAGGRIYRVDPSGYKISKPLEERKPTQGKHLTTSLDIDLQLAAEEAIGDLRGAAVALDVNTGEVLVMASKPDYDLNQFSPRATQAVVDGMNARGAWTNLALNGFYPPGSTYKIVTSIAGMRAGVLTPDRPIVNCDGWIRVGARRYPCYNGLGHHEDVLLSDAISVSCDIYYYRAGELMTPEILAREARRFRLHQPTGIELPGEADRMIIPDPEWKKRVRGEAWFPGDTANVSIGQGDVLVTPLQMACFTASVARGEVATRPTLIHKADAPRQRTESIGLTPAQRVALIEGMTGVITHPRGSARILSNVAGYEIPGVQLAGKTGTAQKRVVKDGKLGTINFAWFICFAPAEKPEVAIAVVLEGETLGEEFGGGRQASPVAATVLKKYFEKKANAGAPAPATLLKSE